MRVAGATRSRCGWQGEGQVLVMELCATDLAQLLAAAQARLDEAAVKALAQQLLQGVHACHSAGAHCC